jgi:hypothetical protein
MGAALSASYKVPLLSRHLPENEPAYKVHGQQGISRAKASVQEQALAEREKTRKKRTCALLTVALPSRVTFPPMKALLHLLLLSLEGSRLLTGFSRGISDQSIHTITHSTQGQGKRTSQEEMVQLKRHV